MRQSRIATPSRPAVHDLDPVGAPAPYPAADRGPGAGPASAAPEAMGPGSAEPSPADGAAAGPRALVPVVPATSAAGVGPAPMVAPRGLKGVVVADTAIGDVRGDEGMYHYRQYDAVDLARHRSLDDVWYLFVHGELPDAAARRAFTARTRPLRSLPDELLAVLPAIAASTDAPLDGLRTALSFAAGGLGLRPLIDIDADRRLEDALRLTALTPTVLTALHRLRLGLDPVGPRADLDWVENYLWMLHGTEATPEAVRAIGQYLVLTVDHGFNASTFTARVIASTGADLGACVVGALGAMAGPLHGGAPSRALALLDEIGPLEGTSARTPRDDARIDEVVRAKLASGEKIMGFGHAVYRTADPRSVLLRSVARDLGGPVVERAALVEERVDEVLEEHRPGRHLRTNVEYYAGVVMDACGVPAEMFTPTFASSRVIGWCAHVLEQAEDGKILRPAARYVGLPAPQSVPA